MSEQPVRVKTPFADDLLFSRMDGFEELGRLYRYELELQSPKENLALDDLLGKDLTVEFDLLNGETRYFHGYVTEFSQTGGRGNYVTYSAIVHPWFWFLTRTSDCRIFQDKTVPDIIKEVFRDLGDLRYPGARYIAAGAGSRAPSRGTSPRPKPTKP